LLPAASLLLSDLSRPFRHSPPRRIETFVWDAADHGIFFSTLAAALEPWAAALEYQSRACALSFGTAQPLK
jgi:hypothetical protein